MNINLFEKLYFVGIGGIGMSALARYFHAKGYQVSGYDRNPTKLTDELISEGIDIHFDAQHIPLSIKNSHPHTLLVVYTPAVSVESPQLTYFKSKKWHLMKRADLLGLVTQDAYTIAVSGTHGKTTTSCILAHILKECDIYCTAFLGGISTNFNSNLLLSEKGNIVVVEADEYDRSFLKLTPDIIIITSVDSDHMDVYKDENDLRSTFQKFAKNIKPGGMLLLNKSIDLNFDVSSEVLKMTYSASLKADNVANNLKIENGSQYFDVSYKDILPGQVYEFELNNINLKLPGIHNVENALAATIVASNLGANANEIKHAVETFSGVKRRFEYHASGKYIYIDDYAHHPEEINLTIETSKALYPNKNITVVFQPHLYSRTRDFNDEFAQSLSLADELILLDIYPAREQPIDGVSSENLLEKIPHSHKNKVSKENLVEMLTHPKREVLLTLGAGDIDQFVEPLKYHYNNEDN